MSHHFVSVENHLIDCLQSAARGPRRNGMFALWLLVRACDDTLPPMTLSGRAKRRRLEATVKRCSSLSLQPTLKRAITRSIAELNSGTNGSVVAALQELVEPARECLGEEAAKALALAVRHTKNTLRRQRKSA
jgi:hypothetical protein